MKKKIFSYAIVPVMAFALLGVSQASAHGWFGLAQGATPEQTAQRQTDMFQQKASLLGVSVDEVKNAWAQGKTMQEMATEKGITQEQLQQKMQDAAKAKMKEHLQTLVSQGVITQAQADQRSAFMDQRMQNGKFGGKHGMMMGMH